jgi:hypothetical protein
MIDNIESTAIVKADDPLKFTAAIVESDRCPKLLQNLKSRIAAHLDKAGKYAEKAEQHRTSAGQLFAQVQELCDEGGFDTFRRKFFPELSRSRAYELLAIGTGKKSVEDIRAGTRERVARHRANQALSVTVTDDFSPGGIDDKQRGGRADHHHVDEAADYGGDNYHIDPASAAKPISAIGSLPKSTKRSILEVLVDGAPDEREFCRAQVLNEYFEKADGTDIFNRIPTARRAEVVRDFLNTLSVDRMMSDSFRDELCRKISAPKEVKKSARKSANKTEKGWRKSLNLEVNSTRDERGKHSRH